MTDPRLSAAGNTGVGSERDQSLALGNDSSLAAQSLLDSFKEFAGPQLEGYAIGGALNAYFSEARAIYSAIKAGGSDIPLIGVDAAMLAELAGNGVKFTPANVVATARTSSGQVVFLETGNSRAGLQHIVDAHATDFARIGVAKSDIPGILMQAISEGKIVGYQGTGFGRPIYETSINGQSQRLSPSLTRTYSWGTSTFCTLPSGKVTCLSTSQTMSLVSCAI